MHKKTLVDGVLSLRGWLNRLYSLLFLELFCCGTVVRSTAESILRSRCHEGVCAFVGVYYFRLLAW